MGFFAKAIGIGLVAAGVKVAKHNIKEENRRKNTVCNFDSGISREEFCVMVKRGGEGIRRITNLYAEGAIAYGTIRSQSGISDWCFRIDFNDYGQLTGRYWITTDNDDSDIPSVVAERIAKQIQDYPFCIDSSFEEEAHIERQQKELRKEAGAICPYCGKKNENGSIKFCGHCGRCFRA